MTVQTERLHPGLNLGTAHGDAHSRAERVVFGFWVFMMSDLIVFGLLFATYATMLGATAGGPGPADLFELRSALIETVVLLTSSLAFGLAAVSMKHDSNYRAMVGWLLVTLALGVVFLVFEVHDFVSGFVKGGIPQASGFLSAYFALVSLHGIHVTAACIWLVVILAQLYVYRLDDDVKLSLLRLGVLWHFLDIVWIGIFSVVYLGGLA